MSAGGVYRAHARHARKFSQLIGDVDTQGLLAEGGAGRSSSTNTAAAGLPAILLLIGDVDTQGLLAEGGAGRSPSTTTAAAGLPAILLLIGVVDAVSFIACPWCLDGPGEYPRTAHAVDRRVGHGRDYRKPAF